MSAISESGFSSATVIDKIFFAEIDANMICANIGTNTAQNVKFSIRNFYSKCNQITFTEDILNGKLHFL